jgi:RimJ/RimL family protein N-acetyltransferase
VNPDPQLILRSNRLGYGPIRSDLLDIYARWMNDLRVTRTLSSNRLPMTLEREKQWFDGASVTNSEAVFTMYVLENMRPIGNVGLHDIDRDSRTAEFGIVIGEVDEWGKGYGTEAAMMMVRYGFDILGLHNIQLRCYAHNPGGLKAYERAGFKYVGVRRQAKRIGRQMVDEHIMDILSTEVEPSDLNLLVQQGLVK